MKELIQIQKKLNAPKGQYNSFGKYKYRSCEDILAAVKPLLAETETTLTLHDEMLLVGNRYYVKATATLTSKDGLTVQTTAFAREEDAKKGMDASQVTGAASSYARKYALNGLFAIDDTKDADSLNTSPQYTQSAAPAKPSTSHDGILKEEVMRLIDKAKTRDDLKAIYNAHAELQGNTYFKNALTAKSEEFKK